MLQYIGRVATPKLVSRNCLRYLQTTLIMGGGDRENITTLGEAINALSDRSDYDINHITVTGQKTGLKISIRNLLIITANYLTGYYLV